MHLTTINITYLENFVGKDTIGTLLLEKSETATILQNLTCFPGLSKSKPSPHMCIPKKYRVAYGCLSSQHTTVLSHPPEINSWCDFGLNAHENILDVWPSTIFFLWLRNNKYFYPIIVTKSC